MYSEDHGGGCCGITHIHDFSNKPEPNGYHYVGQPRFGFRGSRFINTSTDKIKTPNEDSETKLRQLVNEAVSSKRRKQSRMVEVVLTQHQKAWFPILKKLHFKLVSKFVNSNSGNTCHVWHYIPAKARRTISEND